MRLRRLCARCAIVLVAHHEHAAPRADKVVSQESVGRDALAALVVPLDACESRGKDDCLRAPPSCARVSIQLGSSKVCRDLRVNVDFLVGVSDDLLAAERSMHLEGKTNGDARGREIATCAAVGAEIQTCIRRLVRWFERWPLEALGGDRIQTVLPEPVEPATRRWGILVKSATKGFPLASLPSTIGISEPASAHAFD